MNILTNNASYTVGLNSKTQVLSQRAGRIYGTIYNTSSHTVYIQPRAGTLKNKEIPLPSNAIYIIAKDKLPKDMIITWYDVYNPDTTNTADIEVSEVYRA